MYVEERTQSQFFVSLRYIWPIYRVNECCKVGRCFCGSRVGGRGTDQARVDDDSFFVVYGWSHLKEYFVFQRAEEEEVAVVLRGDLIGTVHCRLPTFERKVCHHIDPLYHGQVSVSTAFLRGDMNCS